MNQMIVGMFYARVCRCGAVLQQIEVTPFNAKQVAKFNESANRSGFDTEHVTQDYIDHHATCICDTIFEDEACTICGEPMRGDVCRNCEIR